MKTVLSGKRVLVTGGARRIGRAISLALGQARAHVLVHHGHSPQEAASTALELKELGAQVQVLQADLSSQAGVQKLLEEALAFGPLFGLINNASIFEPLSLSQTRLADWERHIFINLTVPFLLSQGFAAGLEGQAGKIVNLLDWRALRPGADHFPYTISKAGLAALTRSLAAALAPQVQVNGLALGAILPPSSGESTDAILAQVPAGRWATLDEVTRSVLFLLSGPAYITGEIIHVDGGRHLI